MRVEDALSQVRAIQEQMERSERFCCYRWATTAASGLAALLAAALQSQWVPDPVDDPLAYVSLWVAVAAVSAGTNGAEVWLRYSRTDSEHARRQTVLALRQFGPCLMAGAFMTFSVLKFCPQHAVLFPGLWSILFSLGIFASQGQLPAGCTAVAGYYLAAGVVCLRWSQADAALAPLMMAATFGVGQLLNAVVLYRHRELNYDSA